MQKTNSYQRAKARVKELETENQSMARANAYLVWLENYTTKELNASQQEVKKRGYAINIILGACLVETICIIILIALM